MRILDDGLSFRHEAGDHEGPWPCGGRPPLPRWTAKPRPALDVEAVGPLGDGAAPHAPELGRDEADAVGLLHSEGSAAS